ncbi:Ig-like domain-containing protein [Fulvivirga maritima]|uniref:Ig-like domain-containing protein n=1 Tax=Fulvivirga maritima TaxID=2904247 RepID=UPI001F1E9491|nr:Ig-like domain-containing protein [Fulvivirga maritima]UII24702.1 Ig-like domain-containing protein [Fulvivirga maritima]
MKSKLILINSLLFAFFGFTSCSDDDNSEDIIDVEHEINFTSPQSEETVWNEATVTFEVTANQDPDKIEVFLNEELLATLTSEPYEFTFNSQEYEDGDYTLKAVTFDQSGQEITSENLDVKINNTLLDFSIADIEYHENQYIILTSDDGELLTYIKTNNSGESIKLKRPSDFNEALFAMHNITIQHYNNPERGDAVILKSIYKLSPGEFQLGRDTEIDYFSNYIDINFSDIPEHSGGTLSTLDYFTNITELKESYVQIPQNPEERSTYLMLNTVDGPAYQLIKNMGNATYEVSLSQMNYNMDELTISMDNPNYHIASHSVRSIEHGKQAKVLVSNYEMTDNYVFYFPNDHPFNRYQSLIEVKETNGNHSYSYTKTGDVSTNFEFLNAQLDIQETGENEVSVDISGDYDFLSLNWTSFSNLSNSPNSDRYYWHTESKTYDEVHFPELPTEILELYPRIRKEQFINGNDVRINGELFDYDICQSYEDYILKSYYSNGYDLFHNSQELKIVRHNIGY